MSNKMSSSSIQNKPFLVDAKNVLINGLWRNNQALVALLGLCPLMAVSSTAINGLGLGIATMLTIIITNVIVATIRSWLKTEIRIPMFVVIIASVVTVIEMLMRAHWFQLYSVLGIFVPLIVTNCAVIGRAEAYASKNTIVLSALDGFFVGLGFLAVLLVLGCIRELLGYGSLFREADILLGSFASHLKITVFDDYQGFLFAILPPGAFMGLAFIIALKNKLEKLQLRTRAQHVELTKNQISPTVSLSSPRD